MARIELPVRAFLEDRLRSAFPSYNFGRGTGINDLVLKAMAVLLQPVRHEIDCIKINQSVSNYQFMRRSDLDALAANWGKFRQTGSRSVGNVRMYFDTATDYRFSYLQFMSQDGTSFTLVAPVVISAQELLSNRQTDGTYFYDVAVQSTGIGNRYALPAGSIVAVLNAPSGVVRVENVEDFQVTAPDESNYDVVNSMFRNLGMRNLISPASIRAPLLDQFAGVLDIFIAGADHPKMVRDLVTAKIDGKDTQIHVGSTTDIWLNTTSVVQREVVLSYLPSSGRARVVSTAQAAQNEVLYTFGRSLVDIDGLYSSPDFPDVVLDESSGVLLNIANLLNSTHVLGLSVRDRYQLVASDILAGTEMLVAPTKNNDVLNSPLLTDISGFDFSETSLLPGDALAFGGSVQKVTRKSGRLVEVGPAILDGGEISWDSVQDTLLTSPGDRFIPYANTGVCDINDRCVIPGGSAAGIYRVLKVDNTGFWVGNVVAEGSLSFVSTDGATGYTTYLYTGTLPFDFGNTGWVYFGTDAGYDQTAAKWLKVISVTRNSDSTVIVTKTDTLLSLTAVKLVQGLRDSILDKTKILFERGKPASFARSLRQKFGDESPTSVGDIGHTLYVNDTETQIDLGTTTLSALGLGRTASVGNLILFDGTATIDPTDLHTTQGDGSKFSVVVDSIVDEDIITFRPALPFNIPPATRFALMRNHKSLGVITVADTSLVENTLKLDAWPLGLGDGVGYFLKHASGLYTVMYSTAGVLRTLSFEPPRMAVDITLNATGYTTANPSNIGNTVTQIMVGGGTAVGVLVGYNNSTRVWSVVPNDPTVDIFAVSVSLPLSVEGSPATGFCTAVSPEYATNYFDPDTGDIGAIVRQGTYAGVLQSFDTVAHTWTIKPLSEYDIFDNTNPDVITFVDYGTGVPLADKGRGTVFQPATAPQLNTGPVTLTLDRAPDTTITTGQTLDVYPRFPISGGLLSGKNLQTLADTDIQFDPFAHTALSDNLLVMLGTNADVYSVGGKTKFNLSMSNAITPDVVRIHNAPPEQPLIFGSIITANTRTISIPGSGLGFWAQHGRVLKLSLSGNTYYLAIDGPSGQDGLTLLDPVPVSLFSDQLVTYEIVEGFHLPFWTVLPVNQQKYRFFRPPQLGDVLFAGSTGFQSLSSPSTFSDLGADFSDLLAALDTGAGDLVLYIDSGPDASTVPFTIQSFSQHELTLDGVITADATGLTYHILHRNNAHAVEFWANSVIQANRKSVVLTVPNGWDVLRNNARCEWIWDIESHPSGNPVLGNWHVPGLTGSYNPSTKLLTLNMADGQFTPNATVPDTYGFLSTLVGQPCRVMPRLVDRTAASGLSGSAIETFNYYLRDFFALPVIRIQDVQLLNAQTLQAVRSLNYSLDVNDPGLRYSEVENNAIQIVGDDLADAAGQPIRVLYLADLTIASVNSYLQQPDTRVVNANQLAKRMETISVDLSVQVRSQLTETDLASKIAAFINRSPSTIPLSKDKLIQYLYQGGYVSYIDVGTIILGGDYYQADGTITHFDSASNQIFGSETACYLARNVAVAQLAQQV